MPTGRGNDSSCRTRSSSTMRASPRTGRALCSRPSAMGRASRTSSAPALTAPAPSPWSPVRLDDAAALSPDGARLAFVSTRNGYRANIWVLDLQRGQLHNLTGADDVQGDPSGPDGFFRPSWSTAGKWLAVSSDRNADWCGHDDGRGWEHTQELSIYVIRADGQ